MVGFLKRVWSWFWSPTSRWSLGALVIAGGLGSLVFWSGFNAALEKTNTLEFCISCHEMRSTVYEEYRKSSHFSNASGVRATCSDCHVPHQLGPKLIRKIQASLEVYHHFAGTIGTPEKFEEKRPELAARVWAVMKATDSRECRNCHSYDSMAFHKQTARAAEKMQEAMKKGETCIDCHKGITHKLPPKDD